MLEIVEMETGGKTHVRVNGVWCTREILRLQRWLRYSVVVRIRTLRRLAMAMAFHPRLGRASELGRLDHELMMLVLHKCERGA